MFLTLVELWSIEQISPERELQISSFANLLLCQKKIAKPWLLTQLILGPRWFLSKSELLVRIKRQLFSDVTFLHWNINIYGHIIIELSVFPIWQFYKPRRHYMIFELMGLMVPLRYQILSIRLTNSVILIISYDVKISFILSMIIKIFLSNFTL